MIKCCDNKPKYQIVYDIGLKSSEWLLCKNCYGSNPVFQKNIKTITEVKK